MSEFLDRVKFWKLSVGTGGDRKVHISLFGLAHAVEVFVLQRLDGIDPRAKRRCVYALAVHERWGASISVAHEWNAGISGSFLDTFQFRAALDVMGSDERDEEWSG